MSNFCLIPWGKKKQNQIKLWLRKFKWRRAGAASLYMTLKRRTWKIFQWILIRVWKRSPCSWNERASWRVLLCSTLAHPHPNSRGQRNQKQGSPETLLIVAIGDDASSVPPTQAEMWLWGARRVCRGFGADLSLVRSRQPAWHWDCSGRRLPPQCHQLCRAAFLSGNGDKAKEYGFVSPTSGEAISWQTFCQNTFIRKPEAGTRSAARGHLPCA